MILQPSQCHGRIHYSHVCNDVGINIHIALPLTKTYNMCNYIQYIVFDNHNRQLCYWFAYLLYCTFIVFQRVLLLTKKVYYETVCYAMSAAACTSCIYCISWLHQKAKWSDWPYYQGLSKYIMTLAYDGI
jgi:hypothetical protein